MAPTPRNTPRKRQNVAPKNQPAITGFFKTSTTTTASTSTTTTSTTTTSTTTTIDPPPPLLQLPGAVQSGLISVGMRVRRAVPEGYKSGTYAFNKHLPSVGVNPPTIQPSDPLSSPSAPVSQPSKKRPLDCPDQEDQTPLVVGGNMGHNITGWARTGKRTSAFGGKHRATAPIYRGFHKAVSRRDNPAVIATDDFEEADFLRPIDAMEE